MIKRQIPMPKCMEGVCPTCAACLRAVANHGPSAWRKVKSHNSQPVISHVFAMIHAGIAYDTQAPAKRQPYI
jgi:hypothetical protein